MQIDKIKLLFVKWIMIPCISFNVLTVAIRLIVIYNKDSQSRNDYMEMSKMTEINKMSIIDFITSSYINRLVQTKSSDIQLFRESYNYFNQQSKSSRLFNISDSFLADKHVRLDNKYLIDPNNFDTNYSKYLYYQTSSPSSEQNVKIGLNILYNTQHYLRNNKDKQPQNEMYNNDEFYYICFKDGSYVQYPQLNSKKYYVDKHLAPQKLLFDCRESYAYKQRQQQLKYTFDKTRYDPDSWYVKDASKYKYTFGPVQTGINGIAELQGHGQYCISNIETIDDNNSIQSIICIITVLSQIIDGLKVFNDLGVSIQVFESQSYHNPILYFKQLSDINGNKVDSKISAAECYTMNTTACMLDSKGDFSQQELQFHETMIKPLQDSARKSEFKLRDNLVYFYKINRIEAIVYIYMIPIKNYLENDHDEPFMLLIVTKSFKNFQDIIKENYKLKYANNTDFIQTLIDKPGYLSIAAILIVLCFMLVLGILINIQSKNITEPLSELYDQMQRIDDEDNKTNQFVCKRGSRFREMKMLYDGFNRLIKIFKFGKYKQEVLNDTYDLIYNYQGLQIFEYLRNRSGQGMVSNNIGNIHLRNQRYEEAIDSYKNAIRVCEQQIDRHKQISFYSDRDQPGIETSEYVLNDIHMKAKMVSRLIQLANAQIQYLKHQMDLNIHDQILDNLILAQQYLDRYSKINIFMIEVMIAQAEIALLQSQHLYSFKVSIEDISQLIVQYKMRDFQSISDNEKYFLFLIQNQYLSQNDLDNQLTLLESKFLMLQGIFYQIKQDEIQSADFYYKSLTYGHIYDPHVRELCLQQLKLIFHQQEQMGGEEDQINWVLNFIKNNKYNDVVFMLDMSESMDYLQKKLYSIKEILRFFDYYMCDKDRISFMRFNNQVYVDFDLHERGQNEVYLRNTIQMAESIEPTGQTALYDAIHQAIKLCKRQNNLVNNQFIICTTDGDDSGSKMSHQQILEEIQSSEIALIIIGIAINEETENDFRKLCLANQKGFFINNVTETENIIQVYQAIYHRSFNNKISQQLQYESI